MRLLTDAAKERDDHTLLLTLEDVMDGAGIDLEEARAVVSQVFATAQPLEEKAGLRLTLVRGNLQGEVFLKFRQASMPTPGESEYVRTLSRYVSARQ